MMKKAGLALICSALFFASCEEKSYTVVIENTSLRTVQYSYDGSAYTLDPGETGDYSVKAYTLPPDEISTMGKPMSIEMKNSRGEKFTFIDSKYPVELNVSNTWDAAIIIKADDYIDAGSDSTSLTVPGANASGGGKATAKIYTSSPLFETTSPHPVIFDWNFVRAEDEDETKKGTIDLILR